MVDRSTWNRTPAYTAVSIDKGDDNVARMDACLVVPACALSTVRRASALVVSATCSVSLVLQATFAPYCVLLLSRASSVGNGLPSPETGSWRRRNALMKTLLRAPR